MWVQRNSPVVRGRLVLRVRDGNNACAWYVVRSVRADENARRATMRMVVGMVSVLSLYSTMYFPDAFGSVIKRRVDVGDIGGVLMIMKDDRTSSTRNEGKSKGEDENDENDTANTPIQA